MIIIQKNDIVNSIPSSPIVVTADASLSIYSGALVYVNDLEGKITKINLTNMKETPEYDPTTNTLSISTKSISLYDNYILFDVMASSEINNRYMYHSMDCRNWKSIKKIMVVWWNRRFYEFKRYTS